MVLYAPLSDARRRRSQQLGACLLRLSVHVNVLRALWLYRTYVLHLLTPVFTAAEVRKNSEYAYQLDNWGDKEAMKHLFDHSGGHGEGDGHGHDHAPMTYKEKLTAYI